VSLLYGLQHQLDKMLAEGLDRRFERHAEMARVCRTWVRERFALFAPPGYESVTLTTAANTRNINVGKMNEELGRRGFAISNGYAKLKEKTFRIAHMGDCTLPELQEVLGHMDDILSKM
jgi:aspartate aminotransferase-like enzyme